MDREAQTADTAAGPKPLSGGSMNQKWRRWRRAAILSLVLLLGFSIWLNVQLVFKVLDYKGRLFIAREFPDATPYKAEPDGRHLVWLAGDSRVEAWSMPDTEKRRFVNRGVSGFTARQTLDTFRADIATGSRPDVLVVQAGINDVLSAGYNRPSRLPAIALEHQPHRPGPDAIIAQCLADLQSLTEEGRRAGCRVVLLTVFPPGPYSLRDRFFWDAELESQVTALNAGLQSFAGPSVTILDTVPLLTADGRTKSAYSNDSLHLNASGYEVLSRALLEILPPPP
jgi:lysophospholipase L1-like esterase